MATFRVITCSAARALSIGTVANMNIAQIIPAITTDAFFFMVFSSFE